MTIRERTENWENQTLAPYATHSCDSRGRVFPETKHAWRTDFQRDRDRIVHSTAFRRLESKTQVVVNGTGDHFRTRLTHTMEVSVLSRSMARILRLNEDLSEAIALAHDLGHPPFGHHGEETLNKLMKEHGGFEHNRQSLRIVEELEVKYPLFNGLNLTEEVRDGIRRGHTFIKQSDPQPSLEAQLTDAADEITYCSHDLDDALAHKLIHIADLNEMNVCREILEKIKSEHGELDSKRIHLFLIRELLDKLVVGLCNASAERLAIKNPDSLQSAMNAGERLIRFNENGEHGIGMVRELRKFLYQRFYSHPKVTDTKKQACGILEALFEFFKKNPDKMGEKFFKRISQDGLERTICDYLSGMTDPYAFLTHKKWLS